MKIILTFILFYLLLLVPAMAQKVTLKESNSSLESVLMKIRKQTNYDVFYSESLINKANPVTINVRKKELLLVLNEIFDKQSISYSIANQTIVLVPKQIIKEPELELQDNQETVNNAADPLVPGEIVNQQGKPMLAVTIINLKDSLNKRSVSDKDGRFLITASRGDLIAFRSQGHKENIILFRGEPTLKIQMFEKVISVDGITVEAKVKAKLNLNTQIDLTNRNHMNLGQILQGTVPGLTLQILPSNRRKLIGLNFAKKINSELTMIYFSIEEYLQFEPVYGKRVIDALETGRPLPQGVGNVYGVFSNSSSVTLVPELRGSASFGNTEGMMIVIDGFPVDEFPADYPMANVESVQVIKDPKELIKWGPRATAGIILIATKDGKHNKLSINYSSNMYFKPMPKFNMQKLGLATSADLVEFYKDLAETDYVSGDNFAEATDISNILINRYKSGMINKERFIQSMDSLAVLSNENQINMMQQNAFSMNHLITVLGGTPQYKFAVTSSYINTRSNGLKDNSDAYTFDIKNDFKLLKNTLKMKWLINGANTISEAGPGEISVYDLPRPYQMLLDRNGNYVYDQTAITAERNEMIQKAGFLNHGKNILEDARLNSNITNSWQAQSRFEMDWTILKDIKWINSFFYRTLIDRRTEIVDENSSTTRQLINLYGSPTANAVDFYVPKGGLLKRGKSRTEQWNLRSALSFSKQIDDHKIIVSIGGGATSDLRQRPSFPTIYGYNRLTGVGSPIFKPANPDGMVYNFRSLYLTNSGAVYPNLLIAPNQGDSTSNRTANINASLNYEYLNKTITVDASTSQVFSPNYGMPTYAKTESYNGEAGWNIKSSIFPDWATSVRISSGIVRNKLPDLPTPISAQRSFQKEWNNYAIWVSNYMPIQQVGQSSTNLYQKLTLNLFENQLSLSGAYNTQKMNGISAMGALNDSASFKKDLTLRFFSFSAEGSLRDGTLLFTAEYTRSPEGQKQFNGNFTYDIKKESYFTSERISSFLLGATIQNTSSFQGLNLMMGTNSASAGGFGLATNNNFSLMPPVNKNQEAFIQLGLNNERIRFDLRYYSRSDIGISNNVPRETDPSTGLANEISYSNIVNRGVEFYVKSVLVKKPKFTYEIGLNGAYNDNLAKEVPKPIYTTNEAFLTAYRSGYSTSNVWAYKWAGLDEKGSPQIYDQNGKPTSTPDSTTLANAMVYIGVTRAPWTAGFIQESTIGNFFARATVLVNLGAVMKRYIPTPSSSFDKSKLIADRWRKPGDEKFTDVPALSSESEASVRNYITRNSTNSFFSANFARLQEVMLGWKAPKNLFGDKSIKSMTISFHVQNLAFWTQNKYHYDPNTVDGQGRPGLPIPVQYGCTINASF